MRMSETPPPMPPSGSLMKRCKFIWRFLLVSNLALGGLSMISGVFSLTLIYGIQERSFLNPNLIKLKLLSAILCLSCWGNGREDLRGMIGTAQRTSLPMAFLFASAKRRDSMETHKRTGHKLQKGKATVEVPAEPITSSEDLNYDDFLLPVTKPVDVRAPIPEEQQREIFNWMLEEKRKVKTKDPLEKKQIDEEKAILKQFLRAKSIPKF